MPVTRDIIATYRGPRRVVARLLANGTREDRALALAMGGCVVMFIAQMPQLARQAYLEGVELNPLLGASLFAWVFLAPLLLYALAGLSHVVARILGGQGTAYGARLALSWAFLAASPMMLLYGLVAGFIGDSPALTLVGAAWLAMFGWFWSAGLYQAGWGAV